LRPDTWFFLNVSGCGISMPWHPLQNFALVPPGPSTHVAAVDGLDGSKRMLARGLGRLGSVRRHRELVAQPLSILVGHRQRLKLGVAVHAELLLVACAEATGHTVRGHSLGMLRLPLDFRIVLPVALRAMVTVVAEQVAVLLHLVAHVALVELGLHQLGCVFSLNSAGCGISMPWQSAQNLSTTWHVLQ